MSVFAANRPYAGIALACSGWAAFSLQDAITKSLAAGLPVPEILFARSVIIILIASVMARGGALNALAKPRNIGAIGLRTVITLAAWVAYYTASHQLQLAEMATLYFAGPLFVVAMSRPILGEIVGVGRWSAALIGFAGVLIAADPGAAPSLLPVGLTLFAAFAWAATTILARSMTKDVPTAAMVLGQNIGFFLLCGAMGPWLFLLPDGRQLALMLALGLCGGIGQFLWFEGMRRAQASLLAPFEYTLLAWALLWGWTFFGDWPGARTLTGAGVILASGLFMLAVERRRHVQSALVEPPANV